MIDEVRRMSALPRSAVAIIKTHNEAAKQLEGKLGRTPSQAELAEHLGKEVDSLRRKSEEWQGSLKLCRWKYLRRRF